MASKQPFESTHWETVTEEETAQGRVIVRTGVETRQYPQAYIERTRAAEQAFSRGVVRVATGLIVLLVIGALIVAVVASIALSIVIVLIAGALGGLVAWWARRPKDTPTRMVYFRRYGPFHATDKYLFGDGENPGEHVYSLEVATQTFEIGRTSYNRRTERALKELYKAISKIEWGEVYHTDSYELLEVRDREGNVVYQNPRLTGWREEEPPVPATMPKDPL